MNPILEQTCCIGIIPVTAIDDAKRTVPLACSLVEGGLPATGATFRTCTVEKAIWATAAEVPEMLLGAGATLNHGQTDRALTVEARFIVSPGLNPDTVRYVESKGGLILLGTAIPGEMEQAMAPELEAVKFFPTEQGSGVAKLKVIVGPYKILKRMPTGGVSAKNLMGYLSFDQVVACGGTWMVKKNLIGAGSWAEVTRLTREAVDTILGFSLVRVGINCLDVQASERTARTIYDLFSLSFRTESSSSHAGMAAECTKVPDPGVHGHIAIGTSSAEQAIYHLECHEVAIDHAICKTDAKERAGAVYPGGDFGGLTIHLVQK